MSSFHIIEDEQEQINSSSTLNNSLVQHQIERKRIRTIENFNSIGSPLTTATASSAKFSVTSTGEGKSVVSSLSMSLERKESIQYMQKKIAPCIIPAGQSTVIHLDNYTQFMAQRVTTTKTAIKRSEIISESQNQLIVPSSTTTASCSRSVLDVDLKVILGGVTSAYRSNKKTFNMNKQKMLGTKAGSAKLKGRKSSFALEGKQPKKISDKKAAKTNAPAALKPALKKTTRRRTAIKPRQPRKNKAKAKAKNEVEQININEETSAEEMKKPKITLSDKESKVLRPCNSTLQNKKCLSEMTCKYLHSDFPCKYYYLNLNCPQGLKCQFMHNGPLEPKLKEALQTHLLDLLAPKPTATEIHFIQQLHSIEDLSLRLKSFQEKQHHQTDEVIEVMDDGDEGQELVIDERSDDVNKNNFSEPTTNSLTITSNDSNNTQAQQQTAIDKYDTVYEHLIETNNIIDGIGEKLQSLKTSTSNMTPNEKNHELQNIYELLKEQGKRLQIYENLNTPTGAQISTIYNHITNNSEVMSSQSNLSNDQENMVLVNPEIVNEIQTLESDENSEFDNEIRDSAMQDSQEFVSASEKNIIDTIDDNECLSTTNLDVAPQQSRVDIISVENLPQHDTSGNNDMQNVAIESEINEMTNVPKEIELNDSNMSSKMDYEEEPRPTSIETSLNNTNLIDKFIYDEQENSTNNKYNFTPSFETNDNNNSEQLPFGSAQQEVDCENITQEILDTNISLGLDDNEKQEEIIDFDNTLIPQTETLELAINVDEKEVIESSAEKQRNSNEDGEEESPPFEQITRAKPAKISKTRIRLRSHAQQDNEQTLNNNNYETLTSSPQLELKKPIKTRRLRLPKPSAKSSKKPNNEEYQINADIINKLIKATKNSANTENDVQPNFLQDVEVPLTQNIIITNRYMKRAKAKLQQQSLINETPAATAKHNDVDDINVEQTMFALHSGDEKNLNGIENIDVTLLTQTSEECCSVNSSQDPLIVASDGTNVRKSNNEIQTSSEGTDNIETPIRHQRNSFKSPENPENNEITTKSNSKRRISFENPSSSLATTSPSTYKEHFNLGNPHVVLKKLKSPYLLPTTQTNLQADSTTTTTYVNPIVTSSTLLADDKSTQKRHSFTSEHDLDSSLKENKCLKIDNSKSGRKVNFDNRKRTYSEQSNNSKEGDFDTDSCDEKLTVVDTLQTSTTTDNEQKQAFEPFSTHVVTHHSHQHVHTEQRENESDLRQQIENVSNKSDLRLQIQQQQQQKEVEKTTQTGTSVITTNLQHKQYEREKNRALMEEQDKKLQEKQYENDLKEEKQIATARKPYGNNEDGQTQLYSAPFVHIDESEKPTLNASDKYSNDTLLVELNKNEEYATYSSLYNKLSTHSTKYQINFEDSSVNITPISSPTYGDDTIASPSPVRSLDFRLGGEIDGRLTYPAIPYILYEIDLGKININKPIFIDKLKRTIQLDPRIFRTHVKQQLMCKPVAKTSNALVPLTTSFAQPTTSTMVSPYDPRNRTPAVMTDIATPSMAQQTALTPYNNMNAVAVALPSSSSSTAFMHTDLPNTVPLALQYHTAAQPILQPQQQQTPNMFLYGCLQRSPWYQSLMSTMKIQINQSISQLVRALNNFHRERLLNPEMVFDVFKIDCAGELLEIMRNLGVFVDANGIINEQRHVPSFGGRSCCNTMPVNATYSFIQQVLTPNTHSTSMATASSTYKSADGVPVGPLNINEPFVSCYIKAPEPPVQRHSDEHSTQQEGNHSNCNRNCNNNNNGTDNNNTNNNNNYNQNNNNNNNKRFGNQFKKPYDNNYNNNNNNNGNNNYQQRSSQRSSYNNNPRFSKPGLSSPSRANSSPPNSPKGGFEGGGSGNSYGGSGFGRGGRFNNNRRFNNFRNNDSNNDGGSSWSSTSDTNKTHYNSKFNNKNSPTRASSPNSSFQSGSPRAEAPKSSPPPATNSASSSQKNLNDEECWDSE